VGWYTLEWAVGEGWWLTFVADIVANFPCMHGSEKIAYQ